MTIRAIEASVALSSRYGLKALACEKWNELELFGGIGMDRPTFTALADAARTRGDMQATVYELETVENEYAPIPIKLDFASFNQLKANTASLFEVAIVPPSEGWLVLLTEELATFVCGPPEFLADVARGIAALPKS